MLTKLEVKCSQIWKYDDFPVSLRLILTVYNHGELSCEIHRIHHFKKNEVKWSRIGGVKISHIYLKSSE